MTNATDVSAQSIRDWPHAPMHSLSTPGAYIVTSGTYQKHPFFASRERLTYLTNTLLELAENYGCSLQAWAVFPNHYHFVAEVGQTETLKTYIRHLHSVTARGVNLDDGVSGRKVWFQYWDTHLTYQKSYLARLRYVHQNHVHHGIVRNAEEYPWCSAAWFFRRAPRGFYRTVITLPCSEIVVPDGFGHCWDGTFDGAREVNVATVKVAARRRTPYYCAEVRIRIP
jgi:putative transposase